MYNPQVKMWRMEHFDSFTHNMRNLLVDADQGKVGREIR